MDDLIGKKIKGFRFESDFVGYAPLMDNYIGKIGEVVTFHRNSKGDKSISVDFGDNVWIYPFDKAVDHLVL